MNKKLEQLIKTDKEILLKQGLLSTDGASAGVNLPLEVAQEMILKIIRQPNLLSLMRTEQVSSPTYRIPKITYNNWALYPKTENTAPTTAQYTKSAFEYVDIAPKRISAATFLTTEALEDINGGGSQLIANHETQFLRRVAENTLEYGLLGDTAFVDGANADRQATMRLADGLIKQALNNPTAAQVDPYSTTVTQAQAFAGATPVIEDVLNAMAVAMPSEYITSLQDMAFIMSKKNELKFKHVLSKRLTNLGDRFHGGLSTFEFEGIPVIGDTFIPDNVVLLTNPRNMIFAPSIYNMRVVTDYNAQLDRQEMYLHQYLDFAWEELNGVVYQSLD